ncbi:MAG: hypothetical protein ACKO14_07505, partial [Armatimonadota bacterium]
VRGSTKWIKEATLWLQTSLAVVPPAVRKATSGGDAIIAVGAPAIQAARGAASNATSVIPVDVSAIGAGIDPWKGYHSTYNRPLIGEKVAAILAAWATAQSSHQRVRFVGIGADAPLVVFAAALIGDQMTGDVKADFLLEDTSGDPYWDGERYAPGLRAIGDVHVAALLLRDIGVTLYGIRDLKQWTGCDRLNKGTLQQDVNAT